MRKVAVIVASLHPGGAERAMLNLAKGLTVRGGSVDLVAFNASGAYSDLLPPSVELVDLRSRRVLFGLPALLSYLQESRPGIVISAVDHVNLAVLIADRISGSPARIVPTVHKIFGRPAGEGSRLSRRLEKSLAARLYPGADMVIAVSAAVKRALETVVGLRAEHIRVIPNPVVDDRIEQLAKANVDHEWFNFQHEEMILGMGRLVPHKDFETLICAFAQLLEKRPVRLMILGEGPARNRLEALTRKMSLQDEISLPGFVQNPYPLLARAQLFAQSSISESFGIAMVEAMALGVPVVSTACGGPEEILAGGRYGRLVEAGDVASLAAAMLATLKETPHPDCLRTRAQQYSIDRVTQMYLDHLDA